MNVSVSRNGTELGEWPEDQVRTLYKEGQLLPTDLYWKEGMTEWTELSRMIKPAIPRAPKTSEPEQMTPPKTQVFTTVAPTPAAPKTLPVYPPTVAHKDENFEDKKPTSWAVRFLYIIIAASIIKGLTISAHGDHLGALFAFLLLAAIVIPIALLIYSLKKYPKYLNLFYLFVVSIGAAVILYGYFVK